MSTPFFDEGLAEANYREALEEISPKVAALVTARDAVAKELSDLESRIEVLKADRQQREAEIGTLRQQGVDMALSGKSPLGLSKKMRDLECQIEDIARWIGDLEARVPEVVARGRAAQEALHYGWREAEKILHDRIQEKFDRLHEALSKFHANYMPGLKRAHAELVNMDGYPRLRPQGPPGRPENQVSPLFIRRACSIYEVSDRREVPMIGSSVLR